MTKKIKNYSYGFIVGAITIISLNSNNIVIKINLENGSGYTHEQQAAMDALVEDLK